MLQNIMAALEELTPSCMLLVQLLLGLEMLQGLMIEVDDELLPQKIMTSVT